MYGHCLDMKCSSRSSWEQTHAVGSSFKKMAARKARRKDKSKAAVDAHLGDKLQLGKFGDDTGEGSGQGQHGVLVVGASGRRGQIGLLDAEGDQPNQYRPDSRPITELSGPRPVSRPASRLAMPEPPRLRARYDPVGTEFVGQPPPVLSGTAVHFACARGEAELIATLMKVRVRCVRQCRPWTTSDASCPAHGCF